MERSTPSRASHEVLTSVDRLFLDAERPNQHLHVAFVGVLDGAALRGPDGAIDFERILTYVESRLHLLPRYRQRAVQTATGDRMWVDDANFNLRYHVRHTALPAPGTERQLKRMAGRVLSQQLDRGKPLWELWLVEGMEGDRVGLISKVHHCMVDGVAGAKLTAVLLRTRPDHRIEPPADWTPEATPSPIDLFREAVEHRLERPRSLFMRVREAIAHPTEALAKLREVAGAAEDALQAWASPTGESSLNGELGPHRRFDWTSQPLDEVKAIKRALGGTVNDVVLTVTALGLRQYFLAQGERPEVLAERPFRVFCPVNMRQPQDAVHAGGNRVVMVVVDLPLGFEDPIEAFAACRASMNEVKASSQAEGVDLVAELGEWSTPMVTRMAIQATYTRVPANVIVTNIPGPRMPLYLLGARLEAAYPQVPLFGNHGLGLALFSYAGILHWGFNGDWDLVPELHDLVLAFDDAFATLKAAASS